MAARLVAARPWAARTRREQRHTSGDQRRHQTKLHHDFLHLISPFLNELTYTTGGQIACRQEISAAGMFSDPENAEEEERSRQVDRVRFTRQYCRALDRVNSRCQHCGK